MREKNQLQSSFSTRCMLGSFACFFCCLLIFSKLKYQKILSGIPSECQRVSYIQIRPIILAGLIWVQTVCKGDQQKINVDTSGEKSQYRKNQYFRNELFSRLVLYPIYELSHIQSKYMCLLKEIYPSMITYYLIFNKKKLKSSNNLDSLFINRMAIYLNAQQKSILSKIGQQAF